VIESTGTKIARIATDAAIAGEIDLARADDRGLDLGLSRLAVAHDVLEHHDGVVDDDADHERQAQQSEGVSACNPKKEENEERAQN